MILILRRPQNFFRLTTFSFSLKKIKNDGQANIFPLSLPRDKIDELVQALVLMKVVDAKNEIN